MPSLGTHNLIISLPEYNSTLRLVSGTSSKEYYSRTSVLSPRRVVGFINQSEWSSKPDLRKNELNFILTNCKSTRGELSQLRLLTRLGTQKYELTHRYIQCQCEHMDYTIYYPLQYFCHLATSILLPSVAPILLFQASSPTPHSSFYVSGEHTARVDD